MTEVDKEYQEQLKPFTEALKGLESNGFAGIARIQAVEWPLAGARSLEIIVEMRKEISRSRGKIIEPEAGA